MIWFVLSILLGAIAIGGVIFGPTRSYRVLVPLGAAVVWALLTIGLSLHTVGQREVGVVKSFSGTIGDNYKSSGVVLTAPWNHILTESTALQKETWQFTQAAGNTAVSKDQQPIDVILTVNYQVEPRDVVTLYKTVGPGWKSVLFDGRVPQDFKETTAQFSSPDITLKRPELRRLTLERLRKELCPQTSDKPWCIHVEDVFVQNVGYSKDYTAAIEAKLVQRQRAQQAEAKVAQAQAEAQQKIATAEGEARSIELEGHALRNNPEVLRLRAINSINRKATVIFCSSGDCPSFLGGSFTTAAPGGK